MVVDACGANGHFSEPSEALLIDDFEKLIWHQEEPFSSASIYAQWLVMRQARESRIPVLLDGQGADEILGGYRKFYAFHVLSLMRQGRFLGAAREAPALPSMAIGVICAGGKGRVTCPGSCSHARSEAAISCGRMCVPLGHRPPWPWAEPVTFVSASCWI